MTGTPCARVCQRGVNYEAKNVARNYPEDTALADWAVDSYMGVAFFDSHERLIGHVGVMNDRPLEDPARVTYVSPQIEHLTGFSPRTWLGDREGWQDRVHEEDRDRVLAELPQAAVTRKALALLSARSSVLLASSPSTS